MYNVTLGGLAPTNEIFNVSIWFGNGKTRRLGWFPYSLYSFASDRLPTPRGGLLPPSNGANFTLATGWIGRCAVHEKHSGFCCLEHLRKWNCYFYRGRQSRSCFYGAICLIAAHEL